MMTQNDTEQTPESSGQRTEGMGPETAWERVAREREARRRGLRKFGITSGFWDFAAQVKPAQAARPEVATTEADWVRLERERLSRRAALKKMGLTTGMAVFAMFSVDDLARMVGKAMEQRAGDNQVADRIAREFQQYGVVFAAGGPSGSSPSSSCQHCLDQYQQDAAQASNDWLYCYNTELKTLSPSAADLHCRNSVECPEINNALYNFNQCTKAWCPFPPAPPPTDGCS